MTDLSHWDFASDFDMLEVAELIVGIDPTGEPKNKKAASSKAGPVMERIVDALKDALMAISRGQECQPESLKSIGLEQQEISPKKENWKTFVLDTVLSTGYENRIRRAEISRWLSAIGMKSVYRFNQSQPQPIEKASGRWPWGDHHTELLGHLDATARRYWQNYDPTDATTAPTNKDVAEWLVNERKLSQKMAESIASMLRPDGLPTGPRK